MLTQFPQELHNHWRSCSYNPLKYLSAGEKYFVFNKMVQLLAMLCATTQPVVLTAMYSSTTEDIIDDLTPIVEYAFQVAAVNVNGTGPFSKSITLGGKCIVYLIAF